MTICEVEDLLSYVRSKIQSTHLVGHQPLPQARPDLHLATDHTNP